MKKTLQWVLATILAIGGTTMLTSCSNEDNRALTLGEQWRQAGYHVISMRDDFKTIYGDGVVKTDFTFPVSE